MYKNALDLYKKVSHNIDLYTRMLRIKNVESN